MKHHLLLCYLQYLSFYILLKLNGHFVSSHPVIERLIEVKLLLSKLKPIEEKLDGQVSDLLTNYLPSDKKQRSSRNSSKTGRASLLTSTPTTTASDDDDDDDYEDHASESFRFLKPRPELLLPMNDEDGEDSEWMTSNDFIDGDSDLSGKEEEIRDGEAIEEFDDDYENSRKRRKKGIYEAPRLVPVPYVDKKAAKVGFYYLKINYDT